MSLAPLHSGLIVSCQAPADSPLQDPIIIAAMAEACVNNGARGVRIDSPSHVRTTRQQLAGIPIIGLWKRNYPGSEVYITPKYSDALEIARAGADIIAIDATMRERPDGETVKEIIDRIHGETGKLIMADVDSFESALFALEAGADTIGTTLYGYTKETRHLQPPALELLEKMVKELKVPIICEGGISTPEETKKAFNLGAYAVVVGTAITGIDLKTKAFVESFAGNG